MPQCSHKQADQSERLSAPEKLVAEKSWKYLGYSQFSRFLSTDNDFLTFRRFTVLHTRVLLSLQDEIAVLEAELDNIDRHARSEQHSDIHNGTFREEQLTERAKILQKIQAKLVEYDDFLLRTSRLQSLPRAEKNNINSISNWLYNNNDPIKHTEVGYLERRSDLVPLVPKPKSSLRRLLEKWAAFRLSFLWRSEPGGSCPELQLYTNDVFYSSDARIECSLSIFILLLGLAMLISPLWILYGVQDKTNQLGIITAYIVVFVGLLSLATVASPFESLAAAAAYSAVLMVFLQISS